MATKIRLMRLGKIRSPHYRIVIADSRTKRDGRVIETIGKYHPKEDPSLIEVDSERARYWLSVGAQPTEPVAAILKLTGDWQAHKGLPAPESGVRTRAAAPDRKAIFEAAAKETLGGGGDATPAKKTAAKKTAAKKAAAPESEPAEAATPAEETKAEATTAEAAAPEQSKAESSSEPGDSETMGAAPAEVSDADADKAESQAAADDAAAEAADGAGGDATAAEAPEGA